MFGGVGVIGVSENKEDYVINHWRSAIQTPFGRSKVDVVYFIYEQLKPIIADLTISLKDLSENCSHI